MKNWHRLAIPAVLLVVIVLGLLALSRPVTPASASATMSMRPPDFALQHTAALTLAMFLQDEAGITAYANLSQTIRLNYVKAAFRTIEAQTDDYIIGSVPAPAGYVIQFDPHVYVHRSGWVVAYYYKADPNSKIVDITHRRPMPSILELVLSAVVKKDGLTLPAVSYYDFRYPDATHIMFVSKEEGSFNINIPTGFDVYERSYTLYGPYNSGTYSLDGVRVGGVGDGWGVGYIAADLLLPDLMHTFSLYGLGAYSCLALTYRDPDATP